MDEQKQLMSELQEDLRAYQLKQLWEKHGSTLIAMCVAAVIGTGLGVAWRDYKASRNSTYTGQLVHALTEQDDAAKQKALEAVVKSAEGHPQAALAYFRLGAMDLEAGRRKEAVEHYSAVMSDSSQDQGLRDLARLMASSAATGSGAEPATEPVKAGAPFYNDWREAEAWRLYAAGKKEEALARFGALKDDVETPPAVRGRLQAAISLLSPGGPSAASEKPAKESAN